MSKGVCSSSAASALALFLSGFALFAPRLANAQPPPGTGTDMEIDPDAPKPPPEEKKEEPPLPPPEPDAWGVGGKDEEGKFAPQGKSGTLKEEEAAAKEREEDAKRPDNLGPPGAVLIDTMIGFGSINEVLNDATTPTDATIVSIVAGFQYRVAKIWTLGLRFPYSTGSLTGPDQGDGDDFNTFAVGNLELSVRPSFRVTSRLRIPAGLALTLPTASGDLLINRAEEPGAYAQALINQAADASRGWENESLFMPNRFGMVPSVGVSYDSGALHLLADTKLELMFKTGGADPDPSIDSKHEGVEDAGTATNWVLRAAGSYDFLNGMVSPGLRMWLSVTGQPLAKKSGSGERAFSGAQFVLEPTVLGTFPITPSISIRAGLSYLICAGGPLGGQYFGSSMGGLRLQAGLLF